jgi:hypothetical protein
MTAKIGMGLMMSWATQKKIETEIRDSFKAEINQIKADSGEVSDGLDDQLDKLNNEFNDENDTPD